jgi:hypothetical protein
MMTFSHAPNGRRRSLFEVRASVAKPETPFDRCLRSLSRVTNGCDDETVAEAERAIDEYVATLLCKEARKALRLH